MNVKRYIGASIALFVFISLYEWLVHGVLLMGTYQETLQVWRAFNGGESSMAVATCFQAAFALWVAFMFTQLCKQGGMKKGLVFGLLFGVFAGILTASWYVWLPIPCKLSFYWFLSGIGEGIGGGLILGSIYKK